MTEKTRIELKKAMEEKKLIQTYRDVNGVDAQTDPIPVWKLEQLMRAYGQVDILERQLSELKDELREAKDELSMYKNLYNQSEVEKKALEEENLKMHDAHIYAIFRRP